MNDSECQNDFLCPKERAEWAELEILEVRSQAPPSLFNRLRPNPDFGRLAERNTPVLGTNPDRGSSIPPLPDDSWPRHAKPPSNR